MNPLRVLRSALAPETDEHVARIRAAAISLKALRYNLRSLQREVAAVSARAESVSRQVAQLRRLQHDGRGTAERLDALAGVMDTARVASHVRAAVERAHRADRPVERLSIEALWPADVYQVLTGAIPDPIFFEGEGPAPRTLRIPPRLATVPEIAIWTFVGDMIDDVLVPAVAARLGDRLTAPLDLTPGRLVHHGAGIGARPPGAKSWQPWHVVIDLTPSGSATANTASVTLTSAAAADVAPCDSAVEYTCEMWFGAQPA